MARVYYDGDANLGALHGKKIAIIGYGSQGHAHALNLKDSGQDVLVGLHAGSRSREQVTRDGLQVLSVEEAAKAADIVVMLVPDTAAPQIYRQQVEPGLKEGKTLMFAHGFNIHFGQIIPPKNVNVTMVAPKAPGHRMRELFTEGIGVPALWAVEQDYTGQARDIVLAYAKGVGCTRAGVLQTSFSEETETDLFGEQVILCGGVTHLIAAAFETLVNAGYQPECAYFECLHELKLIVDQIYEKGISYMRYSVSDTAEYGDYSSGPRVINDLVKGEMSQILCEIQDGTFARNWILENQAGRPTFNALRRRWANHPIEGVGKELRSMMSWLRKD